MSDGDGRADARAFMEIYARYARLVYAVVWKRGVRDDAIADVVQDVFLEIWRALPSYNAASYAGQHLWVGGIARNVVRGWFRAQRSMEEAAEIDAACEANDQLSVVLDALGRVTPLHRRVLLLFEVEGLTAKEIVEVLHAEGTECTPRGVYHLLEESRAALRRLLAGPEAPENAR